MTDADANNSTGHSEADLDAFINSLGQADPALAERVLGQLENAFSSNAIRRDSLRRCRTLIAGNITTTEIAVDRADQLSTMRLAAGTPSADGSCVLGHDGYLFLTDGSNHVLSRYDREKASTDDLAKRWCDLFDSRLERQRSAGRLFIQMIVPEKISALPDVLPFVLRTPTDLLASIERHFSTKEWNDCAIPVLDIFRIAGPRSFTRLDSHPSAYGSYLIAQHIANMFHYRGLFGLSFNKPAVHSGDLAYRFFGTPLYEESMGPDIAGNPVLSTEPEVLDVVNPPGGGHNGSRYTWKNSDAPIKLKVAVFGNSCFERGGFPALSWWFARIFSEFHFIWSSTVDDAYCDSIGADLVIGQTMERFLFVHEVPGT